MAVVGLSRAGWRKSSYSGANNGCVEVAVGGRGSDGAGTAARAVAVRDSKDPGGPVLAFAAGTWPAFAERLKAGG